MSIIKHIEFLKQVKIAHLRKHEDYLNGELLVKMTDSAEITATHGVTVE